MDRLRDALDRVLQEILRVYVIENIGKLFSSLALSASAERKRL
jgi:hypothetical protein